MKHPAIGLASGLVAAPNGSLTDYWPRIRMTFFKHLVPPSAFRRNAVHAPAPAIDHPSTVLWVLGTGLALGTALVLFAATAQAQTAVAAPASAAAPAEPKYTVAQIAQAFGFIDSNKDGKLSREEAAGFRGVARHFDEADTNKDGVLSRKEFETALSGEKTR